ncbi:DUF2076 domain-containing protein [Cereibacter azotoformans]|uniref:DUF2076 domain-containing protein n=1 Tax=Cereibacter azotoformans TaxID=43057 RepID=A0A2T5K5X5_9RHOB|nr:DUF2076 family protein [Cereibacter azotoformans]AXQ95638.1 DUF2076 domain-containing protein [Cereibacter sphaeroides]PTR17831.1 hypothetical protein C8J28_111119 [Cereibacter azotoformans]UIJ32113.1 DUF2076 domain-containing protein [Cereibacter azotoformans]
MDHNDRQAIEGLFHKLATVEQSAPARDAEAEAFISQRIGRQPGAPYFMAQTIVVQEQALEQAQARIEQLESQVRQGGGAQQGGFFGKLFGGASAPAAPRRPVAPPAQAGGGGFLAGAAQTAMGVAGGMMLANAIGGMFAGEAEAAEAPAEDDMGFDDGGFDDSEF